MNNRPPSGHDGKGVDGSHSVSAQRAETNQAHRPDAEVAPAHFSHPEMETNAQSSSEFFAEHKAQASDEPVLIRKRKKRHRRRNKRIRIALIVAAAAVLVVAGVAFAVMQSFRAGELALHEANEADNIETSENAVTYDEGRTVEYDGHTYKLNENMVSVVVIGFDRTAAAEAAGRAGQADAVMVLALDTETGEATAIGVPRDSMVEVGEFVGDAFIGMDTMQLCLAFSYGDGAELSCDYVTTVVERVLYNMPITYYFAMDMNGVGAINDAIGGVALTPLQTIPNTPIVEGQPTVLFGDNALRYVQWRDTSVLTSSLDRQARQVQYVEAFASQVLSGGTGSIGTILNLFNTASEYSVTNLGVNEVNYLATTLVSNGITSLDAIPLSGEMKQGETYAEFYLDTDMVYETVLDVYYTQID